MSNAIQEFLLREEVSDKSASIERKTDTETTTSSLELKGVSAAWYKTAGQTTLKEVTMEVKPGQLCVIGGPVGSGKVRITAVQILCLWTFVVRNQLTLQCKISDNKVKSKESAELW